MEICLNHCVHLLTGSRQGMCCRNWVRPTMRWSCTTKLWGRGRL